MATNIDPIQFASQNESVIPLLNLAYGPYLLYTDPKTGKEVRYALTQDSTNVGRKEDNDVVLYSKYVSRYHARIDVVDHSGDRVLQFKGKICCCHCCCFCDTCDYDDLGEDENGG